MTALNGHWRKFAHKHFLWMKNKSTNSDQRILGNSLLRNLAALTNSIYCDSQHGALMNRFPVIMTPIGLREFSIIFWSVVETIGFVHNQPRLIGLNLISHFFLACHYSLDNPHWHPMLKAPLRPSAHRSYSTYFGLITLFKLAISLFLRIRWCQNVFSYFQIIFNNSYKTSTKWQRIIL